MTFWANPSGSYYNVESMNTYITGSYVTFPSYRESDDLWERMYVQPKPVIIVCGHCGSHNALGNPTCIQCGAPMKNGKVFRYD